MEAHRLDYTIKRLKYVALGALLYVASFVVIGTFSNTTTNFLEKQNRDCEVYDFVLRFGVEEGQEGMPSRIIPEFRAMERFLFYFYLPLVWVESKTSNRMHCYLFEKHYLENFRKTQ